MKEKIKPIKGCNGYFISDYGNVYSNKSGKMKKLNPYIDSRGKYLLIKLIKNNGKRQSFLLHRLVAEAFIPNPDHYPEVNHKDKNPQNPRAENLNWCTRKQNLEDSYKTLSPKRNCNKSILMYDNKKIADFESVQLASLYAQEKYGASYSSINKYLKWGHLKIVTETKRVSCKGRKKVVTRCFPIYIYKKKSLVYIAKNIESAKAYLKSVTGYEFSSSRISRAYKQNIEIGEYSIKRDMA